MTKLWIIGILLLCVFLIGCEDNVNLKMEKQSSFEAGFVYGCSYYCGVATESETCYNRCSNYSLWLNDSSEYNKEHQLIVKEDYMR